MIIEFLRYLCLALIVGGFTITFAFALGFAIFACVRSSQESREEGE